MGRRATLLFQYFRHSFIISFFADLLDFFVFFELSQKQPWQSRNVRHLTSCLAAPGLTLPTSVSIKHKVGLQSRWSLGAPPPPQSAPSPLRHLPGGQPPSLRNLWKSLQKMKKWRLARPPPLNDHSGVFINLFCKTFRKDSVRCVDGP